MKTLLTLTLTIAASAGLASAGEWGKAPTTPAPMVDYGCACYSPGFEFAGFAAGILPEGYDDELGGGAALSYFFNENAGIELSYSALATDPSVEHIATANLVYRFVDTDACIAPYLLLGGGVITNGETFGVFDVGVGIDFRFESLGCAALFADATYNWTEEDAADFVLIRTGLRIPF